MHLCFNKMGILLPLFFHPFLLTVSDAEVRAHRSQHPSGPQGGVWEWEKFAQDASNMQALPDENFKTIINQIQVSLFIITLHQARTILSHADDKRTLPVLLQTSNPLSSPVFQGGEGSTFNSSCNDGYSRLFQCLVF